MSGYPVGRDEVTGALRSALEPLEHVHAMWEAGAIAFGRIDEWSDIDLQVLCEDGRVEDVMETVLRAVEEVSPVDVSFRLPEPTWHGHSQIFHRLRDAGPFLLLDLVVMERESGKDQFLQPAIHGRPHVYFDKLGDVRWDDLDAAGHARMLRDRVERHRVLYELFRPFVDKELNRDNAIDAMGYYQGLVLRPLVELLRIARSPLRCNFHTRYVHYELPPEDVARLERLFYVRDAADLGAKCDEADAWFRQLVGEVGEGPDESGISEAVAAELAQRPCRGRISP
ncbi:MAG: hypothetical protein ABIG03_01030 [Candidatus Eisenbacteria bacterium]